MSLPPPATVMDGRSLSREILADAARRSTRSSSLRGRPPCLAAVLVGDDPASVTYVRMKQARCRDTGVDSRLVNLPATVTTAQLVDVIDGLSADPGVDGILLQHPVPGHVDERTAFEAIAPAKDVDGVTLHSFAAMGLDVPGFVSCTPGGIMALLDTYGVVLDGMHAVVVGRSPILGRPMGLLLLARDATVTTCHSHTHDLASVTRSADLVVAAAGRPGLIRGDWIKPGAVVIDAGYNTTSGGDVVFDEARTVASLITPVPGGVGPMTIAMLITQTVAAAEAGDGIGTGIDR